MISDWVCLISLKSFQTAKVVFEIRREDICNGIAFVGVAIAEPRGETGKRTILVSLCFKSSFQCNTAQGDGGGTNVEDDATHPTLTTLLRTLYISRLCFLTCGIVWSSDCINREVAEKRKKL